MASGALTKHARLVRKGGDLANDIVLYGADTPNTHKVSMLLEELGVTYDVVPIDISKNTQKEPWFLEICPNGRTPAMLDRSGSGPPFPIFESGAMLLYLCDKYAGRGGARLLPRDPRRRSEVEQWVMWQMSALGPMLGNCMYFKRIAAPFQKDVAKVQFGIDRYHNESVRLYGILDARLSGRDYLCGPGRGEYSVADLACYGYAASHWWAGIDVSGLPHLTGWLARVAARPATQDGLRVPSGAPPMSIAAGGDARETWRRRVEESARAAGRPHFGWRDIAALRGKDVAAGAMAPPKAKV